MPPPDFRTRYFVKRTDDPSPPTTTVSERTAQGRRRYVVPQKRTRKTK